MTVADRLHGERTDPVDDIVLRRRDGAFAYNLAVVVDDAEQGIEEVVRGDDLLPSTAGQALLCDLLDLPRPTWAHVPLVLGPDGSRLAKRHGAVTLTDLAADGLGPADAVAWMARSLDLASAGERVTASDLVDRFDPARIPAAPTTFSGSAATPPRLRPSVGAEPRDTSSTVVVDALGHREALSGVWIRRRRT